jgi:hypothetical protein
MRSGSGAPMPSLLLVALSAALPVLLLCLCLSARPADAAPRALFCPLLAGCSADALGKKATLSQTFDCIGRHLYATPHAKWERRKNVMEHNCGGVGWVRLGSEAEPRVACPAAIAQVNEALYRV